MHYMKFVIYVHIFSHLPKAIAAYVYSQYFFFIYFLDGLGPESGGYAGPPRISGRPYYRNGFTDSNQIVHSCRDHQLVIMGGPYTRSTNQRWRTDAILDNLNTTIPPRWTGRSPRNLHGGADRVSCENCRPHFEISKTEDGDGRHLEKSPYLSSGLADFDERFSMLVQNGSPEDMDQQNLNFWKTKMAVATILKKP